MEAKPGRVAEVLLELAACQATSAQWRQRALVAGMVEGKPAKEIALPVAVPAGLVKLSFAEDETVRAQAKSILGWVSSSVI